METADSDVCVTLVCMMVVALYAYNRYDTPETNRLSTTRSLFWLTGACYIASTLAMFFILSETVSSRGVLAFLGLDNVQKLITDYSKPPVLAAVILTTLLPNTPVVSTADKALLNVFQKWGRIGTGVAHWADQMTQITLRLLPADIAALRDWIAHEADVRNDLMDRLSTEKATPGGWLATMLRIYRETENLVATPAYAPAFRSQREVWQAIHEDFRVFTSQSVAFFVLFEQLLPLAGATGRDALKQAEDHYKEICDKLYERITEFLAQELILTESSDYMVIQRLRGIGYDIAYEPDLPPVGPFVFMGVILMVVILGCLAIAPPPKAAAPLPLAVLTILIAATKTIGAAVGVLPKLTWNAFRRSGNGEPPYLAWVASAVAAAAISFVFERLSLAAAHETITAATNFDAYPLTPIAPTSFVICFAVAILCDVDWHLGQGLRRRFNEGLICGISMVITMFVCIRLVHIQSATASQTNAWFPFVLSFLLGLVSGFFAPYLYRKARGEEAGAPMTALAPPLPGAT
jgi:hypothetical protein